MLVVWNLVTVWADCVKELYRLPGNGCVVSVDVTSDMMNRAALDRNVVDVVRRNHANWHFMHLHRILPPIATSGHGSIIRAVSSGLSLMIRDLAWGHQMPWHQRHGLQWLACEPASRVVNGIVAGDQRVEKWITHSSDHLDSLEECSGQPRLSTLAQRVDACGEWDIADTHRCFPSAMVVLIANDGHDCGWQK